MGLLTWSNLSSRSSPDCAEKAEWISNLKPAASTSSTCTLGFGLWFGSWFGLWFGLGFGLWFRLGFGLWFELGFGLWFGFGFGQHLHARLAGRGPAMLAQGRPHLAALGSQDTGARTHALAVHLVRVRVGVRARVRARVGFRVSGQG